MPYWVTSAGVIEPISGWVICPIFSSSVMPARIWAIRCSSFGFFLTWLFTLGQSARAGSVFSILAQPSRSSAGAPTSGWAVSALAGTALASPPSKVMLASAASVPRRARDHRGDLLAMGWSILREAAIRPILTGRTGARQGFQGHICGVNLEHKLRVVASARVTGPG